MKKIRVIYQSRKGNTKKIADAIATVIGDVSEELPPAYPCEGVNILFLGGGIYAGKIDKKLDAFVRTLTPQRVKNVAVFGTAASGEDKGVQQIKDLLKSQSINVLDDSFVCKGKFLFANRKNPDANDIQAAKEFAQRVLDKLKSE